MMMLIRLNLSLNTQVDQGKKNKQLYDVTNSKRQG